MQRVKNAVAKTWRVVSFPFIWLYRSTAVGKLVVAGCFCLILGVTLTIIGGQEPAGQKLASEKTITYTAAQESDFIEDLASATFVTAADGHLVFLADKNGYVVDTTVPDFAYEDYFKKLEKSSVTLTVGNVTETIATAETTSGPGGSASELENRNGLATDPSYTSPEAPAAGGTAVRVVRSDPTVKDNSVYSTWGTSLTVLGVMLLLAATVIAMMRAGREREHAMRQQQLETAEAGPGGKKGKESAHFVAEVPDVRFADVAGADEAVEDLREMVAYLKEPELFTALGAKPPKGALLTGQPGTGKTLLARAVAGEAGVPFFSCSGSDFVEIYVGVGAKRIREIFEAAKSHPAAILFIDEIDAFARSRSAGPNSNQESENTLIALMTQLDGFSDRGNLIVLAATNRPDILDSAVTRPGRLDRRIEVGLPDRRGRERILGVHASNRPIADSVSFEKLAQRTPGFSGAQLEAIVNEACMGAARRRLTEVTVECFDDAIATVAMGRARESALVMPSDRIVTAWHEAGHTIAAFLLPDADDPVQVSIIPRGPAGGVTWMSSTDEIFMTRAKAHAQLVVAMGGRAGEEYYLDGEFTSGASGDLQSANQLATAMVAQYAMSRLGYVLHDPKSPAVIEVVNELLDEAHERATELIKDNKVLMEALVAKLLEEENVSHAQLVELFGQHGVDVADHVVRAPALPPKTRRVISVAPVEMEETLEVQPEPALAVAAQVYRPDVELVRVPTLRQYVKLRLKRRFRPESQRQRL